MDQFIQKIDITIDQLMSTTDKVSNPSQELNIAVASCVLPLLIFKENIERNRPHSSFMEIYRETYDKIVEIPLITAKHREDLFRAINSLLSLWKFNYEKKIDEIPTKGELHKILTTADLNRFIKAKGEQGLFEIKVWALFKADSHFLLTCYAIVTDYGKNYLRYETELIEEINILAAVKLNINALRKLKGNSKCLK